VARSALRIGPRLLLLAGVGVLGPVGLVGWAVIASESAFTDELLKERVAIARGLAAQIDHAARQVFETLSAVPASPGFDVEDADVAPEQEALRTARAHMRLLDAIVLERIDGSMVAREPAGAPAIRLAGFPAARAVATSGRAAVTDMTRIDGRPAQVFLAPVRDRAGHVAALLGAVRLTQEPSWPGLLGTAPQGARVDLVDASGGIAASNVATRAGSAAEDPRAIAEWLRGRTAGANNTAWRSDGRREVVAFAPLSIVPWGVTVREDDRDARGTAYVLRRWALVGLPVAILIALAFAWGAAHSVRLPLAVLNRAARRIAHGELQTPVPPLPGDEIGELGQSLDRMRQQLAESIERITRHAEELERRVAERTEDLAAARDALEAHNAQRGRLLRKVIAAQEDERKRLARELHDETCQKVAALGLQLDTALGCDSLADLRGRIGEARELVTRTLDDIHRVIFDLRPSVLDDLGLVAAIRWYAARQLETRGLVVRHDGPEAELRLGPEVETAVFRATQEAITNIARHARASTALIEIAVVSGELVVAIEDDGEGFDVESVRAPSASGRGLGLLGLRERMELVGGSVDVDSSPGDGTRVTLRLPLASAPAAGTSRELTV
jgi:signal transduction histidine kinase